MDDVTEGSVPAIILSPEELAKLGVKIKSPMTSATVGSVSNLEYADTSKIEENKNDKNCYAQNTKDTNKNKDGSSHILSLNSIGNKCQGTLAVFDEHTKVTSSAQSTTLTNGSNTISKINGNNQGITNEKTVDSESKEVLGKVTENNANDTVQCSNTTTLQSPVQKRGRGRPRKSLPPVIHENYVAENTCTTKLSVNKDQTLTKDLEYSTEINNINDMTVTSQPTLLQTTSNSPDSSENTICKNLSLVDNAKSEPNDTSHQNSPQISVKHSNTLPQNRRRGRPRKSLPNLSHSVDLDNNFDLTSGKQKEVDVNNDETPDLSSESKFRRKRRQTNYKISDSDFNSNSDTNVYSDSSIASKVITKKRKRGKFKKKRIIDSDTSFNSDTNNSSDELKPLQKFAKIEANEKSISQLHNDQVENMSNEGIAREENKVPKKRGRPKKNSLLSNKTIDSCNSSINETSEIDNSLIITSKRGRKRKEVNYFLLENPDLVEHDIHNEPVNHEISKEQIEADSTYCPSEENVYEMNKGPRKRGRSKKKTDSHESLVDNKIASDDIVNETKNNELSTNNTESMEIDNATDSNGNTVSNDVSDDDSTSATQKSTQYKWTGNATNAINQMFNVINDKNIEDLSHDPLLGKKRRGRIKLTSENILDKNGTSICMVCNETIPNLQWAKHKRKVHYDLAWRKGDTSLEITNEAFVLKTFKQVIREQGYLKCNKCSVKIKSNKKFVNHLDMCKGIVNSNGSVTCAVCKTAMEKTSWQYHNYRQHNNLAWREGDPPLNLEDQELVLRILNGLYKAKKPLHCEKCDHQIKSVLGFLSHKSVCQKTEIEIENVKVECKLCGTKVLPVSMDYHLKAHEKKKAKIESLINSPYFDINVDSSGKRAAAKQALQVIKSFRGQAVDESKYYISQCDFQDSFVSDILKKKLCQHSSVNCIFVDCEFSSDSVESLVEHMGSCEKKPEQFIVCKMCLCWYKEESEIHEHIRVEHNKLFEGNEDVEFKSGDEQDVSENDEYLDEEEREKRRLKIKGKLRLINQSTTRVKPIFLVHPLKESSSFLLYQQAYIWMLEFCEVNYSNLKLYDHLRKKQSWQILDCDILTDYLPKNFHSCDVAAKLITSKENPNDFNELNFRKLELFEVGELYEGDITIFCGGPISALAWLPTPYEQKTCKQILAVAVLTSMDSYYNIDKNYHEPCVVQFWDFGVLDCFQKSVSKPSLLFGMALTCGPIWHLEWCPSGCFDCNHEETDCRLGLLAVAASDSFVYIYSIDDIPDVNERGLIYKGQPVLKLQLESVVSTLEGQAYYPTKISWNEAASHRYVAVGYSTGIIGLFDLLNESVLLQKKNKTSNVFPYKTFQAHYSSITAMTLSHLGGGNEWLFTASFDRTAALWDLSNTTNITPHKKSTIADGVWLTQWPTFLASEDESTFNDKAYAHSYFRALRDLMTPDGTNFTFSTSGMKTLCYSDWLNTILHGSNAGDVMAQFTRRMFFGVDSKILKSSYIKCLFSLTKLVKKDENLNQHPAVTYDEASKKYQIALMDYNLASLTNIPNKAELKPAKLGTWNLSEYNLQGINKVVFNSNPQACLYFAIGYQAGFVRLQEMQFVNALLPK